VSQLCEMFDFKGEYRLPDHSLVSWLWEVHEDVGTTDRISRTHPRQEVNLPYIRMVPEGFLEDMCDKFYELCQVFERSHGNTQGKVRVLFINSFVPLCIEKWKS